MRIRKRFAAAMGMLLIAGAALAVPVGTALAARQASRRASASSGTTSPQTGGFTPSGDGDVTDEEFAGEEDEADGDDAGHVSRDDRQPQPVARHRQRASR